MSVWKIEISSFYQNDLIMSDYGSKNMDQTGRNGSECHGACASHALTPSHMNAFDFTC